MLTIALVGCAKQPVLPPPPSPPALLTVSGVVDQSGGRLLVRATGLTDRAVFTLGDHAPWRFSLREGGADLRFGELPIGMYDLTVRDTHGVSVLPGAVRVRGEPQPPPVHCATSVHFETGAAELTEEAATALEEQLFCYTVTHHPVLLIGNADAPGDAAFNNALARRRAESVAEFLMGHGISGERIRVEIEGELDSEGRKGVEFRRVDMLLITPE